VFAASCCVLVFADAAAIAAPPPGSEWRLVFDDEFPGPSLDAVHWNPCVTLGTCYPACLQVPNRCAVAGSYTPPEDVLFGGGNVLLECRQPAGYALFYPCAAINTEQKFYFQYGYMEIRAKIPPVVDQGGLWPAFWAHDPSPPYGEIDVFDDYHGDQRTIMGIVAYSNGDPASGQRVVFGGEYAGPRFSAGFHTFAADWQPGLVIWYVDGVERFRTPPAAAPFVPAKPLFLIADLLVGGAAGNPAPWTAFPADLAIDYVKVWQRCPDCNDGNACTDDVCGANAECQHTFRAACLAPITSLLLAAQCGDGSVDGGEQCDDGNTAAGDCCSPTCEFEAAGSSCAGGCAMGRCDDAGVCHLVQ